MYIGENIKINRDNDGEITGVSVTFSNEILIVEESFCSDQAYECEIAIINTIQKQLGFEKAKFRELRKIEEAKKDREVMILKKIADLEAELERLRSGATR